jgi:hypothetical protein
MEYDFAILYFGLTRSLKHTYESHKKNVFDVLNHHKLTYKIFMHTWKTEDDRQYVWENIVEDKIDYTQYKLLNPDVYQLDNQDDFLKNINMDTYFYKDVWEKIGHCNDGEWLPQLIKNHLCALESQKRGFDMIETFVSKGNRFKFVMFIRPDVTILNELPLHEMDPEKIYIPNEDHNEGFNDRFAITNIKNGYYYSNRINELADFRKNKGRIVSEKYCKFIIEKYNMEVIEINFKFCITR